MEIELYFIPVFIEFVCFKWSWVSMNMFIFHLCFYSIDCLFLTFANFSTELLVFWYWLVEVVYTFWSLISVAYMCANSFSVNSLFLSFMVSLDKQVLCFNIKISFFKGMLLFVLFKKCVTNLSGHAGTLFFFLIVLTLWF